MSLCQLLLALGISLSGPAGAQEIDRDPMNFFYPRQRTEPPALASSGGRAARDGSRLLLHAKERLVVLADKDDCVDQYWECFGHIFLRHQRDAGAFVVMIAASERSQTLWIDDVTGKVTVIGGDPHLSPDRMHFVVVQYMDCCGYSGIQVWRRDGAVLEAEYHELNGDGTAGPRIYAHFIRWLDGDAFLLGTEWGEPDPPSDVWKSVFGTTAIVRSGGVWTLERPPMRHARATECAWRPREGMRPAKTPAEWLLNRDKICTDLGAGTGVETKVRNCVFSASASPCENIEVPRVL